MKILNGCKDCGDECEPFELEDGICEECQELEDAEPEIICDFIFK